MPYRDRDDTRITELEALTAAEPALRVRRAALEHEHDELIGRVAVFGAQCSEARAELAARRGGGVRAVVRGWLGRSLEELEAEVARITGEHDREAARLLEVTEQLAAATAELTRSVEAGDALATLLDDALDSLREADGPAADEARALDADDLREQAQRAAIAKVIDVVELARIDVLQLATVVADLHGTTEGSIAESVRSVIDPLVAARHSEENHQRALVRLSDTFERALGRLAEVVAGYDATACPWFAALPPARVAELASRRRARIEDTELVREVGAVITCLGELSHGLAQHRDQLVRNARERMSRRRELITGRVR